jgi:hypothetical protein
VEKIDNNILTCLKFPHHLAFQLASRGVPVYQIPSKPAWLQIVHGSNVRNQRDINSIPIFKIQLKDFNLDDSVIGKISNFISDLVNKTKEKINDLLSYLPWFTPDKDLPKPSPVNVPSTPTGLPQPGTTPVDDRMKPPVKVNPLDSNSKIQPDKELATGGIITKPITALVGEAGPEAVIPLEKYFNKTDFSLNNNTLESIAGNTKDTNMSLKILSDALFKLIVVLDKKVSTQSSSPTIIGLNSQQGNGPSASMIANSNFDPIRAARAQFA